MQDLNDKVTGNTLTAPEWNEVPSEIQNAIEALGIVLSSGDLNQLGKALAGYVANGSFYVDSGAANAYVLATVGSKQSAPAYADGMTVEFIAGNTNTAASTASVAGLGVKSIIDTSGGGEIAATFRYVLKYRASSDDFEIVTPLAGEIRSVTATVAANALTLGLLPATLNFRSATLTDGAPATRATSALSLVVPSGATLGAVSAIQSNLILLAIDNAGVVELAVANLSGGNSLDEMSLISTTAMSAAADSANVIYSASARTNVAFRVVGRIESTQTVAGTWAASPSLVQGAGGNALTAMDSIGYGQTYQDVSVSRVVGTTYYNTTGKPILVSVGFQSTALGSSFIDITQNGTTERVWGAQAAIGGVAGAVAVVPPGAAYLADMQAGTVTVVDWVELR